jgi:ferredoxin
MPRWTSSKPGLSDVPSSLHGCNGRCVGCVQVCSDKQDYAAALLDTKGPEIRTAMLKDHKSISLVAGQEIIVEAVGDEYTTFEGFQDDKETRIGLSYAKLCQSVSTGKHCTRCTQHDAFVVACWHTHPRAAQMQPVMTYAHPYLCGTYMHMHTGEP